MTTPGYPDYARLSQQGAKLLYSTGAGNITSGQSLFAGFVGAWPYVVLQTRLNAAANNAQFVMEYFSDPGLTNLVAFRRAIRNQAMEATTQYANLTPWLSFFMDTDNGAVLPVASVSLLATTGNSRQIEMASTENPVAQNSSHIAAGTLQPFSIQPLQPGNAQFSFLTGAASWYVEFDFWSYDNSTWEVLAQVNSSQYPNKQFIIDMPMFDAPMMLKINNGDAVSQNFIFSWVSK